MSRYKSTIQNLMEIGRMMHEDGTDVTPEQSAEAALWNAAISLGAISDTLDTLLRCLTWEDEDSE